MAKILHRIFEIYRVARGSDPALTPKLEKTATESSAPESWTFEHLAVSRSAGVTHVQFTEASDFNDATVADSARILPNSPTSWASTAKSWWTSPASSCSMLPSSTRSRIQQKVADQGQQDCLVLPRSDRACVLLRRMTEIGWGRRCDSDALVPSRAEGAHLAALRRVTEWAICK